MKRKFFLLMLILITGYFAWNLFVSNFSREPIEIIPKTEENPPANEAGIPETSSTPENAEDNLSAEKAKPATPEINGKGASEIEETLNQTVQNTDKKETAIETTSNSFIINKKVSWGYSSSSGRKIDTIVIHSSYDALGSEPYDLDGLINEYKQYGVAPHYLIDRKGKVYRLVDDKNIAYHAGVSKMPDGRTGVNNFSIGIELINTKEDNYTNNQYNSLNKLINYLEDQYSIKYVLGHEDISPDRKTDPWNFDWDEVKSKNSIH